MFCTDHRMSHKGYDFQLSDLHQGLTNFALQFQQSFNKAVIETSE